MFIIQRKKAACLKPNVATHPAFGEALKRGEQAGVELRAVDCIVTEYGVAWLKGRNLRQRAENLIAVAHPDHRAELRRQAQALKLW